MQGRRHFRRGLRRHEGAAAQTGVKKALEDALLVRHSASRRRRHQGAKDEPRDCRDGRGAHAARGALLPMTRLRPARLAS